MADNFQLKLVQEDSSGLCTSKGYFPPFPLRIKRQINADIETALTLTRDACYCDKSRTIFFVFFRHLTLLSKLKTSPKKADLAENITAAG